MLGTLGQSLSHLMIMNSMIGYTAADYVLVLEDDAIVPSTLVAGIGSIISEAQPDWDIISLGANGDCPKKGAGTQSCGEVRADACSCSPPGWFIHAIRLHGAGIAPGFTGADRGWTANLARSHPL